MINPIYFFIDESGDPGDNDGTGENTLYYTELVIQLEPSDLQRLSRHIINWRYAEGILKEPIKLPKNEQKQRDLLELFVELHEEEGFKCSAVYLLKDKYTGPYLKLESSEWNPHLSFRNFIHRQLLEHHFASFPKKEDEYITAIFDYYRMSKSQRENVTHYLCDICNFDIENIVHFDSECSWMLQATSLLAHAVSQIALENIPESTEQTLRSFISIKDITYL